MDLVIASHNEHKLEEIRNLLPHSFRIIGLKEIGINDNILETGDTFEDNALIKARFVFKKSGMNCLSDDSGLLVEALGGRPGVYSARYAGLNATTVQNNQKLLVEMSGMENRNASFKSVIALIFNGNEFIFEGNVNGEIAQEPKGISGFGYDPVFIPIGFQQTFAEMPETVKNSISHRAVALHKLVKYLNLHGFNEKI